MISEVVYMNTKEKLKTLIEEGNRILHFNEHDYLVWKEMDG